MNGCAADDRDRIRLAIAGLTRDAIEITAERALFLVIGKRNDKADADLLHVGIANRSFELADFVFIEDAWLNDGLLVIALVRVAPEAMTFNSIAINAAAPLTAVESFADVAQAA